MVRGLRISGIKRRKKIAKKKTGYDIFGKVKGKFLKLNKIPLSKQNALDLGSLGIDNTTARTFKISRAKRVKKLGKVDKNVKGYFKRNRKKFRAFKIRKGKGIRIKQKFIEKKGKPLIDTFGEKSGLSIRRLKANKFKLRRGSTFKALNKRKNVNKRIIRTAPKPKRIITPTQRRNMLRNLKLARQIRSRNLKRRSITKQVRRTKKSVNRKFRGSIIRKPIRRKAIRKSVNRKPKRTISQATLNALAKGRAKRLQNLRRRK